MCLPILPDTPCACHADRKPGRMAEEAPFLMRRHDVDDQSAGFAGLIVMASCMGFLLLLTMFVLIANAPVP
jgi:hypothetical protein